MDRKILRLKLIMDLLYPGVGINVDNFENRLKLQKSTYLIQRFGIDFGYRFSWYVHGPYSPNLTEAAFNYRDNKAIFDKQAADYALTASGRVKVDRLKSIMQGKPTNESLEDWLELLASIDYLKYIAYIPGEREPVRNNIVKLLKDFGKHKFEKDVILKAWDILYQNGPVSLK